MSIRDEPNIRLKCSISLVLPMTTRLRVYVQNVSVCTGTTRTHVSTCGRGAGAHGDVLNVHTETCSVDTLGFQRVTRTHHDNNDTHKTQHDNTTATPHRDRDRDTEREEKTEEDRQDKRREEVHFAVWWCMAFFLLVVIFWLVPFCARHLSLLNSVKHDSSLISFSAPWQVNSFLISEN